MNYIRSTKLNALDLNLLVALDALISEGSVVRAAARLGRSQPAASHSLRHLRQLFDDPLLVRVGHRMQLTPRAESLREPVRELLDGVEELLNAREFDAATSSRPFRLMMPDLVTSILMPQLVKRISREAPNVMLEVVGWRGPEVLTAEFARSIDIIVSWTADAFPGFHREDLYQERDRLAFRTGHPEAGRLPTRQGFLASRHIGVIGAGEVSDPIDDWLASQKLARRIAVIVPTYLQALQVAAATDLVAFVPGRLVMALADRLGLAACDAPIDPGPDQQFLFYPARSVRDPASIWLRSLIRSVGSSLPGIA